MFVGLDPQKTLQKLFVASIPEVKIVELTCDKLLLVKHIINHHIQTPLLHTSILRNVHYYLCIYIVHINHLCRKLVKIYESHHNVL
jgi:hypothetical protein